MESPTTATKVLIITEETARQVKDKLGEANYGDAVGVFNPFGMSWDSLMAHTRAAAQDGVELVIIDTLANLWDVRDENTPSEIVRALRPIFQISRSFGTAFPLTAHDRKESGGGVASVRGSSALTGAVDMVLKLGRDTGKDNRRILSAIGRADTPAALLIQLDKDTHEYTAIGSPKLLEREGAKLRILEVLPDSPPGMPAVEIVERVPNGRSAVFAALDELRQKNLVSFEKNGRGFVYWNHLRMEDITEDSNQDNHSIDDAAMATLIKDM